MEVLEQTRPENQAMTFDEVSMERSKSFIQALRELKNLRPQLYSAAEYCEKSYLHSEQKQTVLDNLKDYTVRALVNAVDHLGTVAFKLTDLLQQQSSDISSVELQFSCLNQQLLTCQTYTNKEGLRQQQLLAFTPRHHKHYILPNSINKKVHFSPCIQNDASQIHFQTRLQPSGIAASKTQSWHLASETKSTLKRTQNAMAVFKDPKDSGVLHLLGDEQNIWTNSSAVSAQVSGVDPASSAAVQTFGVTQRDRSEGTKALTAFRSFDNPRREIVRAPACTKSMLSAFFGKQKTAKLNAGYVS
ncbi:protein ABIL1-like [Mangifera indica]|uniref:protein ABIL1-like n=1 Tax=Mangifera indica TaxID=29780 RepID=UPI001CFB82B1|nr:protein ABIL1-like [Mangifera indica]